MLPKKNPYYTEELQRKTFLIFYIIKWSLIHNYYKEVKNFGCLPSKTILDSSLIYLHFVLIPLFFFSVFTALVSRSSSVWTVEIVSPHPLPSAWASLQTTFHVAVKMILLKQNKTRNPSIGFYFLQYELQTACTYRFKSLTFLPRILFSLCPLGEYKLTIIATTILSTKTCQISPHITNRFFPFP